MAVSLRRHQEHRLVQRAPVKWPATLAWLLCGTAVVHAWLLPLIIDPRAPEAIAIQLLQPLAAIGAVLLMLLTAWQHGRGSRRWAWLLHACAIISSVAGVLIQIAARAQGTAVVTQLSDTLYLLTYILGLIGTALYLPLRSWWVGSAVRILLDSGAVSVAALVLMHSLLPLVIQPWTPLFSTQLNWLALDVGSLFTAGILGLRYGRSGGPLVGLMFFSLLCLLVGDIIFLVVSRWPDGALWHFVPGPLYTLFRVLLALGAYRGVQQPPQAPTEPFKVMPMTEWLIWTTIPRFLSLGAIAAAIGVVRPPRAALVALLTVSVAREALATYEQRRATLTLHEAQREARVAATQTEEFLKRIAHDLASPAHGLRTIADQLGQAISPPPIASSFHLQLLHLEHMIDQLRAYVQSRTIPLSISTVDVAPLCAAALRAAQSQAEARTVQLRLAFDVEETTAAGDAGAIRRILDNLLLNAIAVSPAGAEVILRVHSDEATTITWTVADAGSGLSPAQQAQIFEPLVRFRSGSGLGLGLAIVRELTRAMHGAYGVNSALGAGSAFWIRLPRASDREKEGSHADSPGD